MDGEMSDESDRIEVAVIGVGRMGRHHARIYAGLSQAKLVGVVDADEDRAATVADEFGCQSYTSVSELLERHPGLRAVSVAVPTVHHASAAGPLLERRVACLIEKPLAADAQAARELVELADRHGSILQVGHTERFNPAVRAVEAMGIIPRFIEVDRVAPMTFRSLDVGVVMDLMIHDLDIVLMLARSPLTRVDAVGVGVIGEHEDVASARLHFASGCVANLTASRLALKTERKMRVFNEQAYVSLDYAKRSGVVIRMKNNAQALAQVREQLRAGADMSSLDFSGLVTLEQLEMDLPPGQDDPLTAELTSFLAAVRTGVPPAVDGRAGYVAVEAAQQVVNSIRSHRWEGLPPRPVT